MKKILVSLMAVMLLVGFVPTTVEASEVAVSEIEASEVESSTEITDRQWNVHATINQNNVNLRTGSGPNFPSLGQVHRGNRAQVISRRLGTDGHYWDQLRMTSGPNAGRTGWVRSDFVNWH